MYDDRRFLATSGFCSRSNNTITCNVTGMARLQARVTSVNDRANGGSYAESDAHRSKHIGPAKRPRLGASGEGDEQAFDGVAKIARRHDAAACGHRHDKIPLSDSLDRNADRSPKRSSGDAGLT
jgi:hypothetical protein